MLSPDATPAGFRFAGVHAGIKRKRPDLGLVVCEVPAVVAGTFTTNVVQAAPVGVTRRVVEHGSCRALVVCSGNANACTGPQGERDAGEMQRLAARVAGCPAEEVAVASTGVIGVPLPMEAVRSGIAAAGAALTSSVTEDGDADPPQLGPSAFAEAIRTTDTFAKVAARTAVVAGTTVRILGVAKGSGMIHPNMATMLAFVFTDAAVAPDWWRETWRKVVELTFNQVSVDGDTSTNDMALALASGLAGNPAVGANAAAGGTLGSANVDEAPGPPGNRAAPVLVDDADASSLRDALLAVATDLAEMIARDGEGATRLIRVHVDGAADDRDARLVARSVVASSLVKTAVHGSDPNWGRVLCAAGYSGVEFDPSRVTLTLAGCRVLAEGLPLAFDEDEASRALSDETVEIRLDLGCGGGHGVAWGCDLSADYVRINADYRT